MEMKTVNSQNKNDNIIDEIFNYDKLIQQY